MDLVPNLRVSFAKDQAVTNSLQGSHLLISKDNQRVNDYLQNREIRWFHTDFLPWSARLREYSAERTLISCFAGIVHDYYKCVMMANTKLTGDQLQKVKVEIAEANFNQWIKSKARAMVDTIQHYVKRLGPTKSFY